MGQPGQGAEVKLCTTSWVEFWGTPSPLAHSVLPSPRAGPFSSSEDPGDSGGCKATEEGETGQAGQSYSQCSQDQKEWETSPEASGLRWPQASSPRCELPITHGTFTEMST